MYIVGTDVQEAEEIAGSSLCDEYIVGRKPDSPFYESFISIIVKKYNIEAIFPILDDECIAISSMGFCEVLLSNEYVSSVYRDKFAFMCWLNENNFPIISTMLPPFKNVVFPLFIKERFGSGSKGYFIARDRYDFEKLADFKNPLAQEVYKGYPEFTVDILAVSGNLIACVPRLREEIRDGKAYKTSTFQDSRLVEQVGKVINGLQIAGICNIQGFKVGDKYYFFEINLRPSSSLITATYAGINIPLMYLKLLKGEQVDFKEYEIIKVRRYLNEVVYK